MKRRPYFNFSGDQIVQFFGDNRNDLDMLKQVLAELQYRSTSKMKALRVKVEGRIEELTSSAGRIKTDFPQRKDPLKGAVRPSKPDEQECFLGRKEKPHDEAKKTIGTTGPKAEAANKETQEEPLREPRMGEMRKPGKLDGVPTKRQFDLKDDIKLEIKNDARLVERYEAGVKALVAEMRGKKTAFKQIVLENGVRIKLDGKENGYQFPYNEDAELFEGAAVVVVVGGTQSEGHIVAFLGNQIVISLQNDYGPRIASCIVRIDNTAMLEALRNRLEKIAKGEEPTFNAKLAESVIFNIGDELAPSFVPEKYADKLNCYQNEAIAKILANEVFYLWGPPGTGKTQTLSALCLYLFERTTKRILLCSNTNQAVDQVLLKLCERFGKQHSAIAEGQIIRVGRIAHSQLQIHWAEHITIEGVVEGKSQAFLTRIEELEVQLNLINDSVARASEHMKSFSVLDGLIADREHKVAAFQKSHIDRNTVVKRKRDMEKRFEDLQVEAKKVQVAGIIKRVFLRSLVAIEKDIQRVSAELIAIEKQVNSSEQELLNLNGCVSEIETAVHLAKQAVANVDRKQVEQQLEKVEEQKQPLIEEISDINKQLEDIRKSIMDRARIVGATVTKVYLSPKLFSSFDVVIVDEASMVMLPALFNAAGLAQEKVVISGDFRQLAPIIQTEQKAIFEAIGGEVFRSTKISTMKEQYKKRIVMLKEQYRMDDQICRLISSRMYKGELHTACREASFGNCPPPPFDGPLTIVDTSSIWPFVNRDPFNSRYNLMNALAIRNLCSFFKSRNYLIATNENGDNENRVGVCTPYAAQSKILRRILDGAGLKTIVDTGTVHRYQGDEKHVIIMDIPDSHGEKRAGIFLDADHVDDSGAMLFNVAVSRAKGHLIVFANLAYLDQKLPGYAILRDILSEMQNSGKVVDVRDVLAMYPITEDLRRLGRPFNLSPCADKTGLFNQNDFEQVCLADIERSRKGVVIFSGFVTEQRVAAYEALFQQKKMEGVAIRCVTRPPKKNGSIPVEQGKAALDGLERLGCVVDTRGEIHEKVVVIDDEIVWFGSLNPLSHTSRTDEVMARIEGKDLALQIVAFMALDRGLRPDAAEGRSTLAENPRCLMCGSRAAYSKGPYGPYWDCEECEWRVSFDRPQGKQKKSQQQTGSVPQCDKCGAPMSLRTSRYGEFYGCTAYPGCKNKMNVN